jgi:hypothetical protein
MRFSLEPNGHPDPDRNASTDQIGHDNPLFVYIRIPGDLDPQDRWERFADPLQQALEKDDLGAVTGGGSQFSEPDEDGNDFVEFCGIDVDLYDAAKGLFCSAANLYVCACHQARRCFMSLAARSGKSLSIGWTAKVFDAQQVRSFSFVQPWPCLKGLR